jgi:hypothetical protein
LHPYILAAGVCVTSEFGVKLLKIFGVFRVKMAAAVFS